MLRRIVALIALSLGLWPATASAHTTTDVVAVAVGDEAVVRLQPTHGCGDSPTIEVRIRAPFEGAVAGTVEGWSATAEPDGSGNTVLAWTGGSLPADQVGSFPIEFVVPGTPGDLLLFPAVQRCENGEELAWISGDPAAEYPAPRLLVLRPGEPPAATIDDVAPDAPGRDQLVAIVDVDAPTTTTATPPPTTAAPAATDAPATAPSTPATTQAPVATSAATTEPPASAPTSEPNLVATDDTVDTDDTDSDSGSTLVVVALVVAAVAVVAGAVVVVRRRTPPAS